MCVSVSLSVHRVEGVQCDHYEWCIGLQCRATKTGDLFKFVNKWLNSVCIPKWKRSFHFYLLPPHLYEDKSWTMNRLLMEFCYRNRLPQTIVLRCSSVVDLRGVRGTCPPEGPNSFNFIQFFGNTWQIRMLAPPPGSWRPFLGEILDLPLFLALCSALLNMINASIFPDGIY